MPEVDVPGLGVVSFPDDMSEDDMNSAINSHLDDIGSYGVQTAAQIPQQVLGMLTNPAAGESSEFGREQNMEARKPYASSFTGGIPPMPGGFFDPVQKLPRVDADDPRFITAVTALLGRPASDEMLSSAAATVNLGMENAEFAESPGGIATMGAGGILGPGARALMALGFSADMASKVPELAQQAGEKSVTGTPQERKEAYGRLGQGIALPAFLAGEAGEGFANLKPGRAQSIALANQLNRKLDIPPSILEDLAVEGGAPAGMPGTRPRAPFVNPENLLRELELGGFRKPPVEPKPPIQNVPRNTFRPEVPETAVEPTRFISAAEEERALKNLQADQARRAGARTKEEIRKLFPDLSRQQAAEIRNLMEQQEEAARLAENWPEGEIDRGGIDNTQEAAILGSNEPTEAGVPGGTGGRGGIDSGLVQKAGQLSEALRTGNAGDLQQQLEGSAMGAEEFSRLASLVSEEGAAPLEAIRQSALRGRSIREAIDAALAVLNYQKATGKIGDQISANEIAGIIGKEAGVLKTGTPVPREAGKGTATSQPGRNIKYAGQKSQTATFYGSLRAFSGEGQGEVPSEEGRGGVQPQAQAVPPEVANAPLAPPSREEVMRVYNEIGKRLLKAEEEEAAARKSGDKDLILSAERKRRAIEDEILHRLGDYSGLLVYDATKSRIEAGTHEWVEGYGLKKKAVKPDSPAAAELTHWGKPLSYWEAQINKKAFEKPSPIRTQLANSLGVEDAPKAIRDALRAKLKAIKEAGKVEAPAESPAQLLARLQADEAARQAEAAKPPAAPAAEDEAAAQAQLAKELYGDEGTEGDEGAAPAEPEPEPPVAPPAAPAAAPPAETDPHAVAKEIGYTYRPGRQIGAMALEGLTPEMIAALKAAGQVPQWDFTNPKTGATFYVPEGSSAEAIKARAAEMDKAFAEPKAPKPETKPVIPETPAAGRPPTSAKPQGELPPLLEVPKDKGLRGRRAQLQRIVEALSYVDKNGKVRPLDNVDPDRLAKFQAALNDVEKKIAAEGQVKPEEVTKPAEPVTPKTLALQAQREAGWDTKWPFVPADFQNKTFRDAIEADPNLSAAEKDRMFNAAEKILGGKIARPKPEAAPAPAPAPKTLMEKYREVMTRPNPRVHLSTSTVSELAEILENLKLPKWGTKAQKIARLIEADAKAKTAPKPLHEMTADEFFNKFTEGSKPQRLKSDPGFLVSGHWWENDRRNIPPGARKATYGEYVENKRQEMLRNRADAAEVAAEIEANPPPPPAAPAAAAPAPTPEKKAELKAEFDRRNAAMKKEVAEVKAQLEAKSGGTYELNDGRRMIVSKNIGPDSDKYDYRVTWIDKDGEPSGHQTYKDLDEVARSMLGWRKEVKSFTEPKREKAAPAPAAPAPAVEPTPAAPKMSEDSAKLADLKEKLTKAIAARDFLAPKVGMGGSKEEVKRYNAANAAITNLNKQINTLAEKLYRERWEAETAPYRSAAAREAVPRGTRNITSKTLQGQKTNLLEQVNNALENPPTGEKVTFSVPGDGEWTVKNDPEYLKSFKAKISKEFPKTVPADPDAVPSKASAKQPEPAKLGNPEPGELGKVASSFLSDDPNREAITTAYSDGTQLVATDGRQLIRIAGRTHGSPNAPVRLNAEGKPVEVEGKYPDYTKVMSQNPELVYGGADTKDLFHILKQANALRKAGSTPDKHGSIGVELFVNPDRTFGARLKNTDADIYEHNIQEGGKSLGKYNPEYLLNAIQAGRQLGNTKLDLYYHGDEGPISFVGKNHESVVMPLRLEGTELRDKASDFSRVAGKGEHHRIPTGLPPLPDPEGLFETTVEGTAGQRKLNLNKGEVTLQKLSEGKPAYWQDVGSMPIKDIPKDDAGRKKFFEEKFSSIQGIKEISGKLVDALKTVLHDRNEAAKEVNNRNRDAGSKERSVYYSGIPFPGAAKIEAAVSAVANHIASGDWIQSIGKANDWMRLLWKRFAMHQAPRFTNADRLSGELGVRAGQAKIVARAKGEFFADRVLDKAGKLKDKDFNLQLGTALTEDNLRDLKAKFSQYADEADNREEYIARGKEDLAELQEAIDDGDPDARKAAAKIRRDIKRWEGYTDLDAEQFKEKADNVTSLIGIKGSPFATEEAYQAFLNDDKTKLAIGKHIRQWQEEKDPIFRKANDLAPDQPVETRGAQTGARINLAPVFEGEGTPTTIGANSRPGLINQAATRLRKDRFSLPASGSAESYEGSYKEILAKGYEHEFPIAAQHEWLNHMLDIGLAKLGAKQYPDIKIRGEKVKAYEYKVKNAPKQWIYLPESLGHEYEAITGLDKAMTFPVYSKMGEFLTKQSVKGLAEGSTHVANLLMETFTGVGPTRNPLINALLKSAGRMDLVAKLPMVVINAFGDKREQMLELAEFGAAKEHYGGKVVGRFLNAVDRGVRLTSDDIFKKLAADGWVENTETNRREFVSQLGSYNKKFQPALIRALRDTQIQPFATAQHTFNVMGLRRMAMDPGAKASSMASGLALRADIAAGWLGFGVLTATLNYLVSGTASGPKGTRLGAVGWIGDDKRLHQFDLGRLTGYSRGPRILGIQGVIEARRMGLNREAQIQAALQGPANVVVSMISGPLNRFATIAATGYRPGSPMVKEVDKKPPQSPQNFDILKTQIAANIGTALKQANPAVDFSYSTTFTDEPVEEALARQVGRYTPSIGPTTKTLEALPKIVEQSQLKNYGEDFASMARKIPAGQRMKFVRDKMNKDSVAPEMRARVLRDLQKRGVFSHP